MLDLWYKSAVIYCLDVETYMDANDDGIGDFEGLTERLDYLAGLGITCIWLMPFYPTPNRDNGYDVKDFYNVDPRLGTLGDFVEFTRQANERGMRVIVDLVVNHTSIEHHWFQAACKDKNSKYRDFYIWADEKPEDSHKGIIFPGVQDSTWTYSEEAEAYYFHQFYEHQADLNVENPDVWKEIQKVMGFWLQLGVSGFRLDAAPFLVELKGADGSSKDDYAYLKDMRQFLSWRRGDAIILAEANVPMEAVSHYFGDGDKMQMLFNFMANQHLILALAREEAAPLIDGLKASPEIPQVGQWAYFVRNHDELSLDKLSDEQQEEILTKFKLDKEKVWIYDRGIRCRFPPMVQGDPRRVRLAYSLMFTLPGTPVLFYGEEIGLGDDLSQQERNSIRAPMQWSGEPNAGFSTAPPDELFRPVISDDQFGYKHLNVIDQRRDASSLLNWMERAIRMRKECPEFGWGDCQMIGTGHPSVFAHRCDWRDSAVMAVHNLSRKACTVTLNLKENEDRLIDLLGDRPYHQIEGTSHEVELDGYGYRWFRIGGHHL